MVVSSDAEAGDLSPPPYIAGCEVDGWVAEHLAVIHCGENNMPEPNASCEEVQFLSGDGWFWFFRYTHEVSVCWTSGHLVGVSLKRAWLRVAWVS